MRKMMTASLLVAVLSLPITIAWALEPEVQAAKDEGMRLWGISEWIKMQPYLEQAADAGDVEAMYYLGEATRLLDRGLSRRAMAWYLQAAEQGDVHAMLRLFQGGACIAGDRCPEGYEDWHHAALAVAQPKAEAGDSDAMLLMFDIYRMFDQPRRAGDWLERAAEAGQPEAQTILGNQILDGRGWYLTNGRRLSAAEAWFRQAAEQRYVPAMDRLAATLSNLGRHQEAWTWFEAASELGHINGRRWLGSCYMEPEKNAVCQVEKDLVKGWAIYYAIHDELGNTSSARSLSLRSHMLDESKQQEAETLAEREWIGREPPLSNFPPRFGY
ncbi:tetratricopeptide repeat protein [Billgrantia desiderata]|uniref:tetratricopeptide repeat protein n=1 Tax=Billgrantia desiderata TaxID=52021 RepID=UPI00089F69B8|nr:tetratricopeptide repeat protein [Halomonas desiderata]SEG42342.1 hypothetical protein SAMN04487953_13134 [Halomonas desiderata]